MLDGLKEQVGIVRGMEDDSMEGDELCKKKNSELNMFWSKVTAMEFRLNDVLRDYGRLEEVELLKNGSQRAAVVECVAEFEEAAVIFICL